VELLLTAPNTHLQEADYEQQLIEAAPDDNKFVDVAMAAIADYLVTNDRHFAVLKSFGRRALTRITLRSTCARLVARQNP
jgi:predicted nucleic acid-binding protein